MRVVVRSYTAVALIALFAAACADSPTATRSIRAGSLSATVTPPPPNKTTVCKVGPAGTYWFTISSSPTEIKTDGYSGTLLVSNPFSLQAGECKDVFQGAAAADLLYISEVQLPAGTSLVKIEYQPKYADCINQPLDCLLTETTLNYVGFTTWDIRGYLVTFYNEGEENGFQGCTPGYWKNHPAAWAGTGFSTGQDFDAVFGVNAFNPNITLMAAANLGGGGLEALARHAVAALLNSASGGVDYPFTTAQVIAAVQAAVASGNYEATKNQLAGYNEAGCPLN